MQKPQNPHVFVKITTPLVANHLVNYTYLCHSNNQWLKIRELDNCQLSNELFPWLFFTNIQLNWHSFISTSSIAHINKSSVAASCSHFLNKTITIPAKFTSRVMKAPLMLSLLLMVRLSTPFPWSDLESAQPMPRLIILNSHKNPTYNVFPYVLKNCARFFQLINTNWRTPAIWVSCLFNP